MRLYSKIATAVLVALPLVRAITPEGMLAAPRRSAAVANPSGEFAVWSKTNYSWDEGAATTVWEFLNLTSGELGVWSADTNISEFVFVGDTNSSILYINGTNEDGDGGISLYTADALDLSSAQLVGSLPAPYSGLKATQTESGDIHFLVYGMAYPNGTAYNEASAEVPSSSARIYTDIYVRHWDYYLSAQRNAVFGGVISGGQLNTNLKNYVTGLCNVTCAESPVQPFGSTDYFDLSPDGTQVAFITKNIDLPAANFTSSQVYLVPFDGSRDDATPINDIGVIPGVEGASVYPTFSKDGSKIAYLQMNGINYESDRQIMYVADANAQSANIRAIAGDWDRSPDLFVWSNDDTAIYASVAEYAQYKIFPIPADAAADYQPHNITNLGVPGGMQVLPSGELLVSDAKIWSSRDIYTITPEGEVTNTFLRANEVDEELEGLGPEDYNDFWYSTNSSDAQQHGLIVYPEGFSESNTYPLMFWVHGGPQVQWSNTWSTRWNPKVWADQGYVVIMPNPTASGSYGQKLVDDISSHWGDRPYWDLVHAWDYVNETFSYIDTSRGVSMGASYGGYMMNWFQGHELGRRFNALMTHDGVTNTLANYATEELWFIDHDFGGSFTGPNTTSTYWEWNPILYIDNWSTPHFVVHNDLDYRLPVSEGLMLFNLLQVKGVPSKFLNFPDENHWVTNRDNSIVWHTEIMKWMNYYSGISNADSPY